MKKHLPISISLLIIFLVAWYVKLLKEKIIPKNIELDTIGSFTAQQTCHKQPNFLKKLHIPSPIAIDLSQQRYKGLAFLYGHNLLKALHLKTWEKFDHFSSYALDPKGNMYLSPMPYISIKKKTFEFQKNIYKLDTNSGNLSVWMSFDDVYAGANNPYGVIALEYDCEDNSLWVSAIDETTYQENKGVIYHIDIDSKTILQKVQGIEALSLKLVQSSKGKTLLVGSARNNILEAYAIQEQRLSNRVLKLFELEDANQHVRKIVVRSKNHLKLQAIPFSYSLIAQTQEGTLRKDYNFVWKDEP